MASETLFSFLWALACEKATAGVPQPAVPGSLVH